MAAGGAEIDSAESSDALDDDDTIANPEEGFYKVHYMNLSGQWCLNL